MKTLLQYDLSSLSYCTVKVTLRVAVSQAEVADELLWSPWVTRSLNRITVWAAMMVVVLLKWEEDTVRWP